MENTVSLEYAHPRGRRADMLGQDPHSPEVQTPGTSTYRRKLMSKRQISLREQQLPSNHHALNASQLPLSSFAAATGTGAATGASEWGLDETISSPVVLRNRKNAAAYIARCPSILSFRIRSCRGGELQDTSVTTSGDGMFALDIKDVTAEEVYIHTEAEAVEDVVQSCNNKRSMSITARLNAMALPLFHDGSHTLSTMEAHFVRDRVAENAQRECIRLRVERRSKRREFWAKAGEVVRKWAFCSPKKGHYYPLVEAPR